MLLVYEVLLERRAGQDIRKLPIEEFHRIIKIIKSLAQTPRPVGCRKISSSKSDWRIRSGDYRIIYEIDKRAKAVKIMRVRHRREAYK